MVSRRAICSAINCWNSQKDNPNLSMFRVPNDPVRSKEWVTNSGRKELLLKDSNYLYHNIKFCSAHFEDTQFMNSNKNRLVWNAVPTIFSNCNVKATQTESRTSKENQSLVNNVETENNTSSTDKAPLKPSLPTKKTLNKSLKRNNRKRKLEAIEKNECQTFAKRIKTRTKAITSSTDKVPRNTPKCVVNKKFLNRTLKPIIVGKSEGLEKYIDLCRPIASVGVNHIETEGIEKLNDEESLQLESGAQKDEFMSSVKKHVKTKGVTKPIVKCKFLVPVKQIKNKGSNPTDKVTKKLILLDNKSLFRYFKPLSLKEKSEGFEKNESVSLEEHIETEGTEKSLSEVSIHLKSETKKEEEPQSSVKHVETKVITNPTDKAGIKIKINPPYLVCQSSTKHTKTQRLLNPSDETELKVLENNSSMHKSPQHKKLVQLFTRKLNRIKQKGRSPINRIVQPVTLKDGVGAIDEDECQSSVKHIETKHITNSPDEVLEIKLTEPEETKSSVKHIKTKHITNSPDEVLEIKLTEPEETKSSVKHIETKHITNSPDEVLEIKLTEPEETKSSVKHIETKGRTNPTVTADLQLNRDSPDLGSQASSKQNNTLKVLNPVDKLQIELKPPENDSSVLDDELSEYKKRVEAFKRKLGLGPPLNRTIKPATSKSKALAKNNYQSSVKHIESKRTENCTDELSNTQKIKSQSSVNHIETKGINSTDQVTSDPGKINCHSSVKNIDKKPIIVDIKSSLGPQTIECQSSVKTIELKKNSNLTDKLKIKLGLPGNNFSITNSESSKLNKKVEAFEKIINGLKTKQKSEVIRLKKINKELRRSIRRKDFMISKLRREKNDLKHCTYYTKSKPNYRRDKHFIEQTLSKYVSRDTLHIIMSQVRNSSKSFGNRWDDETKMFALNIHQTSPRAYKILSSYLQLPNIRTLQKFIQDADLMALSGLNYNSPSDVKRDNENEMVPRNFDVEIDNEATSNPEMISVIEVEYDAYGVMTDHEIVSSFVEVESEAQKTCSEIQRESEDTNKVDKKTSNAACLEIKDTTGENTENEIYIGFD